jgi:MFS transporter, SHS family, lactate transporter
VELAVLVHDAVRAPIQERLAASHSYTFALTVTMIRLFIAVAVLAAIGKEARGGKRPSVAVSV